MNQPLGPYVPDRSAPLPADELRDFLNNNDDDIEDFTEVALPRTTPVEPVPRLVSTLLSGPNKDDFLKFAKWFHAATSGESSVEVGVETNVGLVRFSAISWNEHQGLLRLLVDSSRMPFAPTPLTSLRIRHGDVVIAVTCVSALSPIFPGTKFCEIVFVIDGKESLIQNTRMEKDARLKENAPSIVSGRPSDDTESGEPIRKEERQEANLTNFDFDVPREDD